MSDERRPVPTGPGWWWRREVTGRVHIVNVRHEYDDPASSRLVVDDDGPDVRYVGGWIAPVLTPAEADALRERAERAEAERDRYREAVGRLRAMLSDARSEVMRPESKAFRHYDIVPRLDYILASTTDEAIRGYDAPPADAGLLAKANAALVAEVAELRAELAAERGEEAGALPGWSRADSQSQRDHGDLWVMDCRKFKRERATDGVLVVKEDRLHLYDAAGLLISIRRDGKSARAAMRAAEAEARRLGLLKDEP